MGQGPRSWSGPGSRPWERLRATLAGQALYWPVLRDSSGLLSELLAPRQLSQCLGGCRVVHTEWPRGPSLQRSAPLAETWKLGTSLLLKLLL